MKARGHGGRKRGSIGKARRERERERKSQRGAGGNRVADREELGLQVCERRYVSTYGLQTLS